MSRREINKEEKRHRLREAGLHVFLADGFTGASIEHVVAEAQVARGTFYLYFADKTALFRAVTDPLVDAVIEAVEGARDALRACEDVESTFPIYVMLGARLAEVMMTQRDALDLYFAESRAKGPGGEVLRAHVARIEGLTAEILEDAATRGVLRRHDVRAVSLAIVGAIERLGWAWVSGDPTLDVARLPEEVTRLFRAGLAPLIEEGGRVG